MPNEIDALEELLSEIQRAIERRQAGRSANLKYSRGECNTEDPEPRRRRSRKMLRFDAIDRHLESVSRETQVKSLRDDDVIKQFRREWSDGLIRQDTARHLLQWIGTIISSL